MGWRKPVRHLKVGAKEHHGHRPLLRSGSGFHRRDSRWIRGRGPEQWGIVR
jgi:hypothetical protein